MTFSAPTHGLQLRTLIKPSGELELTLATVETPTPGADEVLIRIEATPINPSDIGLLFGAADMSAARFGGTAAAPVVTAPVPERAMKAMAGRLGQSLPAGKKWTREDDPVAVRSLRAIVAQAQRAHRLLRDLMYVARPPEPRPRAAPVAPLRS